jgi:hypothetical protein
MKTVFIKIDFAHLNNETHTEFHETAGTVIVRHNPAALGIAEQHNTYSPLVDSEVSLLDLIRRSDYTLEIEDQDGLRDRRFRGFADAVKSGLNHFDPVKRDAAGKINLLLEHYGNIAAKTLDRETAAIDDLLRELGEGEYRDCIGKLALEDWTRELDGENQKFKNLMQKRYGEVSNRPTSRMKAVRKEVDTAFRNLTDRVDALVEINGIALYEPFVRELNAVIERYKNILAQSAERRNTKEK